MAKSIEDADGKCFKFDETILRFSDPVYHGGQNTSLGWVLMLTVEYDNERVTHASDVQGPQLNRTLDMLLSDPPQLLIINGPPAYLEGFAIDKKSIDTAIKNLVVLANSVPILILEHHMLREDWRIVAKPVYDSAEKAEYKVCTAAEFLGEPNNLLEQHRRVLYETNPPPDNFIKWAKAYDARKRALPPPI